MTDQASAVSPVEKDQLGSFPSNSEMARIINDTDWARTPLGPISTWSASLKMMVRVLLANRFPLLLWWGSQFCQLYNDAYRPILGTKHPKSLGQPARECWPEIWDIIGPLVQTPFTGGPATWMEDIYLEPNRHGFKEETHFTIAYSPVPDESAPNGIGGVLATVHEITEKVVGERRVLALRDLSTRAGEAKSGEEACEVAAQTLGIYSKDIPFALLYLIDANGKRAYLSGVTGIAVGTIASPQLIDLSPADSELTWPLGEVLKTETSQFVDQLTARFGEAAPRGPWDDPPNEALVLPIRSNIAHQLSAFLVAGISPRLLLNDSYRSFLELVAGQIATAIANARAYEDERRRAEALAELDRAKTTFFSNVSHEFRTPLTLMLGPLDEILARPHDSLAPDQRSQILLAHRNGLRLLKLVNTLLDFSRIEAGRTQASYEPTDLAAYTAELASVFRSAIEKAGLKLLVNCPSLAEPIYVDREMWEKIVLNLVSNAFKFTFEGEIEVELRETDVDVELTVRDTGIGIAPDQLPQVFQRFHRGTGTRGRTHEGTGIGLALVQELTQLHDGTASVTSEVGRGSTFKIAIPKGSRHLDPGQIATARTSGITSIGNAFVEEALRWLPTDEKTPDKVEISLSSDPRPGPAGRIILADDNADMREYVKRLLSQSYEVEGVSDGHAALKAARERLPDLMISDIMMPNMDGFELLRELRADPVLKTVPLILLSARAGEESKVEGLQAGADDYLIKPFSTRELLARVGARLEISRIRRESELRTAADLEAMTQLRQEAEEANRLKDEFLAIMSHELRNPLNVILGYSELMSRSEEVKQVPNLSEMANAIKRNAAAQAKLIRDLLDVSRLRSGKLELNREIVSISVMVNGALDTVRADAEAKQIQIELIAPNTALFVNGDSVRLQQIIWNLLNNAIKFTPNLGRVTVRLSVENNQVRLAVEDTGEGIDSTFLPHVFELFRQADASATRVKAGLGVGLAIVQELVELHGGTVTVSSSGIGKGATFTVSLPLSLETAVTNNHRDNAPIHLNGLKVLVVDDSEDTVEMLVRALHQSGATVIPAFSGSEGLRIVEEMTVDAILSDVSMPGMDGFEFARRLRLIPGKQDTPILALTGFGRAEDMARAKHEGFYDHLTKPIDLNLLTQTLYKIPRRTRDSEG